MYWLANIAAVKLGKFSNAVCPNNHNRTATRCIVNGPIMS